MKKIGILQINVELFPLKGYRDMHPMQYHVTHHSVFMTLQGAIGLVSIVMLNPPLLTTCLQPGCSMGYITAIEARPTVSVVHA